jgi:hypothetical protein
MQERTRKEEVTGVRKLSETYSSGSDITVNKMSWKPGELERR